MLNTMLQFILLYFDYNKHSKLNVLEHFFVLSLHVYMHILQKCEVLIGFKQCIMELIMDLSVSFVGPWNRTFTFCSP